MAVLKMIETRELINSVQDGLKPTDKPVSQSDMFAFIEDLVPGKSCWPQTDACDDADPQIVRLNSGHRSSFWRSPCTSVRAANPLC